MNRRTFLKYVGGATAVGALGGGYLLFNNKTPPSETIESLLADFPDQFVNAKGVMATVQKRPYQGANVLLVHLAQNHYWFTDKDHGKAPFEPNFFRAAINESSIQLCGVLDQLQKKYGVRKVHAEGLLADGTTPVLPYSRAKEIYLQRLAWISKDFGKNLPGMFQEKCDLVGKIEAGTATEEDQKRYAAVNAEFAPFAFVPGAWLMAALTKKFDILPAGTYASNHASEPERERVALDQVSKGSGRMRLLMFGEFHEFDSAISEWNANHDVKYALVNVRPKSLIKFK